MYLIETTHFKPLFICEYVKYAVSHIIPHHSHLSLQADNLYVDGSSSPVIDIDNPDLTKFPKFARAKCVSAILEEGDMVFIPGRCVGGWGGDHIINCFRYNMLIEYIYFLSFI